MKKRTLLFTSALLLGIGSLTFFQTRTTEFVPQSMGDGSGSSADSALAKVEPQAQAKPIDAKAVAPVAAKTEFPAIKPRTWNAKNLSGQHLDNIPYGVGRVDEVVFEEISEPDQDGLVQRTRVLRTDFHYPLVQTVELVQGNLASGDGKIVDYMAMVADHVMVQVDLDQTPVGWEGNLAGRGIGLRRAITDDGLYIMEFPMEKAGAAFDVITSLRTEFDWVRFAEPDMLISALDEHEEEAPTPSDPRFPGMWGLENSLADFDINAREGWRVRTGAPNVIVAVLDTGIDYNHPDLRGNMWVNPRETENSRDDSGNGFIDDIHGVDPSSGTAPLDFDGHGTHVAGTIGAVGNNGLGVTGVAWDVQLMAVRILGPGGSLSGIVRGIDYAWENGAQVLNNSWGVILFGSRLSGTWRSEALADAILRTRNAGAIFVTAAGNDGVNVDHVPDFPAGHQSQADNVVNVAALESGGDLAFFSNFGVRNVQVAAPGADILSTLPGGTYGSNSGTSMAAPHVAGMLALLIAEYPEDPYDVIIQRLYQRSVKDPFLADRVEAGRLVDLGAALNPSPLVYRPLVDTSFRAGADAVTQLSVGVSGKDAISYQWFKNGQEIIGQTGASLTFADPSESVSGHYRVEISSIHGTASSEARLRAAVGDPDLASALNAGSDGPGLSWFTSSDAPWSVDGDEARSGDVSHRQSSEIRANVAGPGTLTFSWRVSSESIHDKLELLIGGVLTKTISGESGPLLDRTYEIPEGSHTLVWRYSKDSSRSEGSDAGWLGNVTYQPNHPVIDSISPSGLVVAGSSHTLSVSGRGPSLTYVWTRNGSSFPGNSGPELAIADFSAADAGSYEVTVSNSFGFARRTVTLTDVAAALAPVILQHPQSFSGTAGEQVVLWSDFEATVPWNIQWFRDGEVIDGAEGTHLNLGALTSGKVGSYTYSVTNDAGFVESLSAVVQIAPPVATFAGWLERFRGVEAVVAASGDGVDPLLRFALGIAPGEPLTGKLPQAALVPGPQVSPADEPIDPLDEGTTNLHMALVFERPTAIEGVVYVLEASSDLTGWTPVDSMVELFDLPGGEKELVQLREATPLPEGEPRRFLRMKVETVD